MTQNNQKMSRADQVRERRKIEPVKRKPIPNTAQVAQRNAQSSSRVTSRRSYSDSGERSYVNFAQKRKRMYVSTGSTGSEVRMPSLPRINLSWRFLSGTIAVIMTLGLFLMKSSSIFTVSAINLMGGVRIPAEEISASLDISGKSIVDLVPSDIESEILTRFSDIKSAKVSISLPANLSATIEERIPALVWLENEEPRFWVDQEGYTFPIRGEATLPIQVHSNSEPPHSIGYDPAQETTLPTFDPAAKEGQEPSIDPQFVSAVQKINTMIPTGSPLLYDRESGLGWTDPHGWKVYFGTDLEQIDLKLVEYDRIVQAILDKNLQPTMISLEFLRAPYYRME